MQLQGCIMESGIPQYGVPSWSERPGTTLAERTILAGRESVWAFIADAKKANVTIKTS